jgi:hypothetical protein
MSDAAGELVERNVFRLAVRPGDVDRRGSIRRSVDLGDHEVPF